MNFFEVAAVLITITALFGFVNERYIKLPTTIGVMFVALVLSLALLLFGGPELPGLSGRFLEDLNFDSLVLEGMLSFLLFAGSLTVNLDDLNRQRWPVLILATVGVIISTLVVGTLIYLLLLVLGIGLPYLYALTFGALITPTDPIAVLSILKKVGVPKDIETLITGESLFNDGVGVVVFSVIVGLLGIGGHGEGVGVLGVFVLFVQEAIGGVLFGLVIGIVAYYLLKEVDNYTVEILITLALVMGGYALALELHTSGPLAMVVAGLFIGNRGRLFAMSEKTREHIDTFWELVDEILNAVLFVLIGLEMLMVDLDPRYVGAMLLAIPLVLLGRLVAVGVPITYLRRRRAFLPYTVRMMVWGGLRGGISVALALSLPPGPERDHILTLTYGVVVFAILVQGLTISRVAGRIPEPV